jgi:hypothetical protein
MLHESGDKAFDEEVCERLRGGLNDASAHARNVLTSSEPKVPGGHCVNFRCAGCASRDSLIAILEGGSEASAGQKTSPLSVMRLVAFLT